MGIEWRDGGVRGGDKPARRCEPVGGHRRGVWRWTGDEGVCAHGGGGARRRTLPLVGGWVSGLAGGAQHYEVSHARGPEAGRVTVPGARVATTTRRPVPHCGQTSRGAGSSDHSADSDVAGAAG